MLIANHYVKKEEEKNDDATSEMTAQTEPAQTREKHKNIQYKWAFGQKIPVDFEWKVM